MKKAPVHAIYKRHDAFFVNYMACRRVFAGMKWKFFGVRKRRERTFIHNLCPLCGRRRGASSADRVGRSYGADRVVRPYTFCAGRRGRRPLQTGKWLCSTLDKPAGMGIIINRRGRCDKRSAPCKIGNLRIRNRHLAEWRFRLFSF